MGVIRISATGDSFMTRRLPVPTTYPDYPEIQALLNSCDFRFNNLEFTVHDSESAPSAQSGGTWAMSEPAIMDDLASFGFNIFSTANNHSLDYGEGGVLATIRHLKERSLCFCGTGEDLSAASAPAYISANGATVAFIALSGSYKPFHPAGIATKDLPSRPGLNPLGHKTVYHVKPAHFTALQEIAQGTAINAQKDYSRSNGYLSPSPAGTFAFGDLLFQEDTAEFTDTTPSEKDVERTLVSIQEAKRQADLVFISLHDHSFDGFNSEMPSHYFEAFAHRMIDGGADGIIGHGPHQLRGIEIYKGKPIFYSLGNFVFQTETVRVQPAEAFINKGLDPEAGVRALMMKRSNNNTTGYGVIENMWRSVITNMEWEEGILKSISLYPIHLGMKQPWEDRGWPHLSGDEATLKHLSDLSRPYGTSIEIKNGVGIIINSDHLIRG